MDPLISVSGLADPDQFVEQKRIAAALFAAALAARVSPTIARPVAKYGLGVELNAAGEVVGFGPLAATNVAPQPLGIVPPQVYGLEPDFYLPSGAYKVLPDFVPGVAHQRAKNPPQIAPALPERKAPNPVFQFRPLAPGEDRYGGARPDQFVTLADLQRQGVIGGGSAAIPPVPSVSLEVPVSTKDLTPAQKLSAQGFAEAALRYSTQPLPVIQAKLAQIANDLNNPYFTSDQAPYVEGFYGGLVEAYRTAEENLALGVVPAVPGRAPGAAGAGGPPPIIGSGGTGTVPAGPGALPAPGPGAAPGNTPGQEGYGNPGGLMGGPFVDGLMQKKHGDP